MKRRLRVYKKTVSIVNETAIGMYESLVGNKKGFLLESYDKNYDRLKLYMQKMADIAHENEQKIDTGNIELDAILNNKINEAQDSNIKTETDITIPAGIIKDGYDIAVILGNILDNAIRASLECDEKERSININIKYNRGIMSILV